MVRRQQTLKINHIPAQLTPIRPHHPSFRHRRFTSRTSATENHSPSESANSFTRSQAGATEVLFRGSVSFTTPVAKRSGASGGTLVLFAL